jgi:hypothetical protein
VTRRRNGYEEQDKKQNNERHGMDFAPNIMTMKDMSVTGTGEAAVKISVESGGKDE